MNGINKVMLIGNLGAKPELKYTQSQQAVATISVATSRSWRDSQGNKKEDTQWHRVVVWGKLAEQVARYLDKGRQVYVEGRLQTRSWVNAQGNKQYTTEVVASQVQFLGSATKPQQAETEVPAPAQDPALEGLPVEELPF